MENSKKIKLLVIFILVIAIVVIAVIGIKNYIKNQEEAEKQMQISAVENFFQHINEKKYEEMYDLITEKSKETISEEDFVKRNKNIYNGIEATNIKLENIQLIEKEDESLPKEVSYTEKMVTAAGEISFNNSINLYKENDTYKIEWSSNLIFPELNNNYKVRISTLESTRGSIKDRDGNLLAYDGKISSVGIVPGKLGKNRDENISKIADLLQMSIERIEKLLSASYVQDDIFVALKSIPKNSEIKEQLLEIPGVKISNVDGRVYNLGEEAAHLIGYIQSINSEELEKHAGEGYTSTSKIGKSGIEYAYEEILRGIDGAEIYIEDENGIRVKELIKRDKKDGTDVTLTIDYNLQKSFYNQMKDDKGLFVVMNSKTGELLALVSTPSYDSNDFILGISTEKWNDLNNDEAKPLYNRFKQSYCPGSTFKPLTAAIALSENVIDEKTTFNYSGTSWQKDTTWGDYYVTTLTAYPESKNVENALIRSDNIFFSQLALKIGKNTMTNYFEKLGFNEELDFEVTLKKSQYLNENAELTELKLANTGYGQGDVLVNPVHMASMYSAFVNDGNMIKPYVEYKNGETTILKEKVFTEEAVNIVQNALEKVIESPNGTANDAKIAGLNMIGKTGTAELKKTKDDTESGTLGWFNCITLSRKEENLVIVGMVENTQNNSSGGSHYVISKIRKVLSGY